MDYFFDKQPPVSFVDELRKPLHARRPQWFGRTELREGETSVQRAYIVNKFPYAKKLLETAAENFDRFLPLDEIAKAPVIRERITRGFYSPTNRPPKGVKVYVIFTEVLLEVGIIIGNHQFEHNRIAPLSALYELRGLFKTARPERFIYYADTGLQE